MLQGHTDTGRRSVADNSVVEEAVNFSSRAKFAATCEPCARIGLFRTPRKEQ